MRLFPSSSSLLLFSLSFLFGLFCLLFLLLLHLLPLDSFLLYLSFETSIFALQHLSISSKKSSQTDEVCLRYRAVFDSLDQTRRQHLFSELQSQWG